MVAVEDIVRLRLTRQGKLTMMSRVVEPAEGGRSSRTARPVRGAEARGSSGRRHHRSPERHRERSRRSKRRARAESSVFDDDSDRIAGDAGGDDDDDDDDALASSVYAGALRSGRSSTKKRALSKEALRQLNTAAHESRRSERSRSTGVGDEGTPSKGAPGSSKKQRLTPVEFMQERAALKSRVEVALAALDGPKAVISKMNLAHERLDADHKSQIQKDPTDI